MPELNRAICGANPPEQSWKQVSDKDPAPLAEGDPARPLDFILTPAEKDVAVLGTLHLEAERQRLNRGGL